VICSTCPAHRCRSRPRWPSNGSSAILRPQLEELGDWEQVFDLSVQQLSRGSSAARQRRAMERRGRISDVVDLVVADTRAARPASAPRARPSRAA
jgi:hypothetical protein